MYQAKRSGASVAVYGHAENQHRPDRLALRGELRNAIERDELLLHYQPKLDMRDGTLVGLEALVRWQHPQRGLLTPSEFVLLADQSGLIHPLSVWVLEAALRQQKAWRALSIDIAVAVNLSRRMLHDPQLPATVAESLSRWDVPASALEMEITESSLMADPLRAAENLNQLRALGVRMSIDDFGTGYSSLASLKDLCVDELKIDRSFVQAMATDASARAIVRAIIDLADALKLQVVAEGVEDRATWDVLVGLGCDMAQGYLLSPPLASAEFQVWLAQVAPTWVEIAASPRVEDPLQERILDAERGCRPKKGSSLESSPRRLCSLARSVIGWRCRQPAWAPGTRTVSTTYSRGHHPRADAVPIHAGRHGADKARVAPVPLPRWRPWKANTNTTPTPKRNRRRRNLANIIGGL